MAADMLAKYGREPAPLPNTLVSRLNEFLPPFWSRNNPIDILCDASPERFEKVIETCLDEKCFDAILVILAPQALTRPEPVAEKLTEIIGKKRFPIYTTWMGGRDMRPAVELLNRSSIPTYGTPERAVRAFLYMYEYHRNLELLQEIPPKLHVHITVDQQNASGKIRQWLDGNDRMLSEVQSKELLTDYGIPVNPTRVAVSKEQAVSVGKSIGFPLAMKILSPDITHKTDANGVQLDIRDVRDVERAWDRIIDGAKAYNPEARILGVSVQPFITRPDYEILLGAKKDPNFGPVIVFGMGGIFTEILKDRSLGLPPMNRLIVRHLMEGTKLFKLLKGYRNRPGVDMVKMEEIIIRLSQLVVDFPEIKELDLNPVVVKDGIPVAIDARILLEPSGVPSPMHLVISPYPEHLECCMTTKDGLRILVRPIKPEDAPLIVGLFNTLSAASIYYRFFRPIKELSREMLARFTQIDYDREIAMVAIREKNDTDEIMMGVARIILDPDGKIGEFSVLVGDPWHGLGIGSRLLIHALEIARNRGVENVYGVVLRDNVSMLALGKSIGLKTRWDVSGQECEMTIDLRTADLRDTCEY
jgi:acetyltransferase